jgi:DNA-directed RNA polymerase subunit H (RpoH/RPB5)
MAVELPTTDDMIKVAVQTVQEMLVDRGYTIQFIDPTGKDTDFFIKANKVNDWIICCINEDEKVNIADMKNRLKVMERESAGKCILVYRESVTSSAKNSLENYLSQYELFSLQELQLNITKHRLVPRHTLVTDAAEKAVLDKDYKGKLPTILSTEPVSRYFAFPKGEYVRIHRKNGSVMYRVVK